MTGKHPNLYVIGAMKSGTSSLHNYLSSHPDIYMSPVKEPCFFVDDETDGSRMTGYLRLFEQANAEAYIGESSTQYTKLRRITGVPERIMRFNPEARFIYIMRDPVRRVLSHYRFAIRKVDERRPLVTAIHQNDDYVDFSNYVMQLHPYFALFSREQIYTLTLEELEKDPRATMSTIYEWLGIDSEHDSRVYAERANVTPNHYLMFQRSSVAYRTLRSSVWQNWGRRIPRPIRDRARYIFTRGLELDTEEQQRAIDYLRACLHNSVDELCDLLGRDFPEWTAFYGK